MFCGHSDFVVSCHESAALPWSEAALRMCELVVKWLTLEQLILTPTPELSWTLYTAQVAGPRS